MNQFDVPPPSPPSGLAPASYHPPRATVLPISRSMSNVAFASHSHCPHSENDHILLPLPTLPTTATTLRAFRVLLPHRLTPEALVTNGRHSLRALRNYRVTQFMKHGESGWRNGYQGTQGVFLGRLSMSNDGDNNFERINNNGSSAHGVTICEPDAPRTPQDLSGRALDFEPRGEHSAR